MRTSSFVSIAILLVSGALLFGLIGNNLFIPAWLLWIVFILSFAVSINDILGRPIPFFRWSFLRMMFGMKTLLRDWQVGDGREEKVVNTVLQKAKKGDAADVVRVIDNFGHNNSLLMNVGDRKGAILDSALMRTKPNVILELGCYVGYSAIRMAQKLSNGGHLYSVEFSADNAALARRIIDHAGLSDRVTVVVGSLG
ncbi:MAG TPA: hypothetical protein VFW11_15420, partial [Cyclobacteriaceae bacterium]|nr:hypothetical protein [Cyclobacteriaceae bacterium]